MHITFSFLCTDEDFGCTTVITATVSYLYYVHVHILLGKLDAHISHFYKTFSTKYKGLYFGTFLCRFCCVNLVHFQCTAVSRERKIFVKYMYAMIKVHVIGYCLIWTKSFLFNNDNKKFDQIKRFS